MSPPSTNMIAWFKPELLTGMNNGDDVLGWPDSSPGGPNTAIGNSPLPTYVASGIGGVASVAFSSGSSFSSSLSASDATWTIFVVAKPAGVSGNQNFVGASANGGRQFRLNGTTTQITKQNVVSFLQSSGVTLTAGTPHVFTASSTTGSQALYVDGTARGTATNSTAMTSGLTTIIGGLTSQNFVGQIAEIIVYSSVLNSTDRATVHSYFQNKYGITVSDYVSSGSTGEIKVYNGSSFTAKPVKVWNGSSWVIKPLKRWNGSAWIVTPY